MQVKEAILNEEKRLVEEFLKSFDLEYSDDIIKTYYCLDRDDEIIGTVSISSYIIKCLAVKEEYREEGIARALVMEALEYFRLNNILSYQVFTKKEYEKLFLSLGFRKIVNTEKVVMLEGGIDKIDEKIEEMKKILELNFSSLSDDNPLACIVMNANPITNGHVHLVTEAKKKFNNVLVLIVEENKSEFSFKERLSLAYLALKRFNGVYVMPSSKYIVSTLTFPSYFIKDSKDRIKENAWIDALVFKEYFMKKLHIKARYVGSEDEEKMKIYNTVLKDILNDELVIVPRLKEGSKVISAKTVRELFKKGKIKEALEYCPNECKLVLENIVMVKYGDK